MNMTLCILGTLALTILAAVLGLVIEYKLEPLHRAREARRWADRVRQDEINSALERVRNAAPGELVELPPGVTPAMVMNARRDAHERHMADLARRLDQDQLARDSLRAYISREGLPPPTRPAPPMPRVKPPKAALFMPPAELGQW